MTWGGIKRDKYDIKMSLLVRMKSGGRCEKCLKIKGVKGLENSHFHGRRKKSVRWSLDNCSALCHGCHRYFTENPADHTAWMIKKLGIDRFNLLTLQANTPCFMLKGDYEVLNMWLDQELEKLK